MLMDSNMPDHLQRNATMISEAFADYGAEVDTISIAIGVTVALYKLTIVSTIGVIPISSLQEKYLRLLEKTTPVLSSCRMMNILWKYRTEHLR